MAKENVIEWLNNSSVVTLSLSQGKYINKVKKMAESDKNIKLIKENSDGSILAHVPLNYIKISAPRKVSDEQREKARERFINMCRG